MTTTRRGFIGGVAALFCTPAIVRASSLMAVRAPSLVTGYITAAEVAAGTIQANTLLSPSLVTREALAILTNRLELANYHRERFEPYDPEAGIGTTVRIRQPERFEILRYA